MSSHRRYIVKRSDFIKYWSLRIWRNPNKKFQILACTVCYPKKPITIKKVTRIFNLELE